MWDRRVVTSSFSIDNSFQVSSEWLQARNKPGTVKEYSRNARTSNRKANARWQPPDVGTFKINVDASIFAGVKHFAVGMVIRNHEGEFMVARNIRLAGEIAVWEAEAVGVREALSWIKEMNRQGDSITIESDSQVTDSWLVAYITPQLFLLC